MMLSALVRAVFRESGLASVWATGRDAWMIILARASRMLAYGSSSLVLALFFAELGVADARIGLFMTLTLAGDVVLSLLLTLVADRAGRRRTVLAGSALMVASGTVFALCENYWALLLAAVVGVISASGGDFGPFRAIEESTLAELTTPATRSDVLTWYVLSASLGSSISTELAGRFIEYLVRPRTGSGPQWSLLDAYHACFWAYVAMGIVNMACCLLLSDRCELKRGPREGDGSETEAGIEIEALMGTADGDDDAEGRPLDDGGGGKQKRPTKEAGSGAAPPRRPASRWSQLARVVSKETRATMLSMWFLLMVDSLADGMVNMSLTTYYMDQRFRQQLSKAALGDFLSASFLLSACSSVFAGPLSRHIGLVNTMVFTHIPSSAAVLLFPFSPSAGVSFALLLLRVGLNNLDQAPRTALIAAVVRPHERTAVMGITGMLRTLAATTGPSITGLLAGSHRFWVAFVVAGSLRLAYDLGLWAMFINIRLHQYEPVASEPGPIPRRERRESTEEELEEGAS